MSRTGEKGWVVEPALFITTQTTIPQLTALMFALALAILGFAAEADIKPERIGWLQGASPRDVALVLVGFSALCFMFAMTACVKSHGWDYYAVPAERRDRDGLAQTPAYIAHCSNRCRLWHLLAARTYNGGLLSLMAGVAFLLWPISPLASRIVGGVLTLVVLLSIFNALSPDVINGLMDRLVQERPRDSQANSPTARSQGTSTEEQR